MSPWEVGKQGLVPIWRSFDNEFSGIAPVCLHPNDATIWQDPRIILLGAVGCRNFRGPLVTQRLAEQPPKPLPTASLHKGDVLSIRGPGWGFIEVRARCQAL